MTASTSDYAADRLDDDGGPLATERHPIGRLVWAPAAAERRLDGAWWPRSRDAVAELAALVPRVSEHLGGPVRRVSANIDAWGPDQPRPLRVDDVLVRLGWFHTLDPDTVTLGRHTDDRVTLVVVLPGLGGPAARGLLRRLSTVGTERDVARGRTVRRSRRRSAAVDALGVVQATTASSAGWGSVAASDPPLRPTHSSSRVVCGG